MSSEISDYEEDSKFQTKGKHFKHLKIVTPSGWDTCAKGFDDINSATKSSLARKGIPIFEHIKDHVQEAQHQGSEKKFSRKSQTHFVNNESCSFQKQNSLESPNYMNKKGLSTDKSEKACHKFYNEKVNIPYDNKPHTPKNWVNCSFSSQSNQDAKKPIFVNKSMSVDPDFLRFANEPSLLKSVSDQMQIAESDDVPLISTYSSESEYQSENIVFKEEDLEESTCEQPNDENFHAFAGSSRNPVQWHTYVPKNENAFYKTAEMFKTFPKVEHDETLDLKPQKYISGGFAELASKLQKREKTLQVIWAHEKKKKVKLLGHKCLKLLLKTRSEVDGFIVSKCLLLNDRFSCPAKCDTSFPLTQKEHSDASDDKMPLVPQIVKQNKECLLLLKKTSTKNMDLKCGSTVVVYPPWHWLEIPNIPNAVLACTKFFELSNDSSSTDQINSHSEEILIFSATGSKKEEAAKK